MFCFIAIRKTQSIRLHVDTENLSIFINGEHLSNKNITPAQSLFLKEVLAKGFITRNQAIEIFDAKKRQATVSDELKHLNQLFSGILQAKDQQVFKSVRRSKAQPEPRIIHQLKNFEVLTDCFIPSLNIPQNILKAIDKLKSIQITKAKEEAAHLEGILKNQTETEEGDGSTALQVGIYCSDQTQESTIVQLMTTLASLSGIRPVFNPNTNQLQDFLGFIVLLTPDTSPLFNKQVDVLIRASDMSHKPVFIFKERSVQKFQYISSFIEFSQEQFWFAMNDISQVFSQLYNSVVSQYIQTLASSAPEEYISKYADLYDVRLLTNIEAKKRIASTFVEQYLNKDELQHIFLDSGTVTYYIAEKICEEGLPVKIFTNNLSIARLKNMCSRIHLIPGSVDHKVEATTGPECSKYLHEIYKNNQIELSVLGLRSFDIEHGFGEDTYSLASLQRVILENAPKTIIVAQGEKLLKQAKCPLYEDFDNFVETQMNKIEFLIHEPTLSHLVSQTSGLKMFAKKYEVNLQQLKDRFGKERVQVLGTPSQVSPLNTQTNVI